MLPALCRCRFNLTGSGQSSRLENRRLSRKAALEGYSAYFGTYFVDEQTATVTHRRTGNINPGDMGDFVRKVEFRDNRLILRSETNNIITWERVSK
jgi:hypothetical protein